MMAVSLWFSIIFGVLSMVTLADEISPEQRNALDEQKREWFNSPSTRGLLITRTMRDQLLEWGDEPDPILSVTSPPGWTSELSENQTDSTESKNFTESSDSTESMDFTESSDFGGTWRPVTKSEVTDSADNTPDNGFTEEQNVTEKEASATPVMVRGAPPPPPEIHKDIRLMTKKEWDHFTWVLQMAYKKKVDPNRDVSVLNLFAAYHRREYAPIAHGGPAFVAWHSLYLFAFWNSLKEISPDVTIPIIDFRPNTQIPNHCDSCIYTSDFLGNNYGPVNIGPFSNWKVYPRDCESRYGSTLARYCGNHNSWLIDYDEYADIVNNFQSYKEFVSPYDSYFEDIHGLIHSEHGGHLSLLTCATNDPIFFMLHGFIHSMFDRAIDRHYAFQQQLSLSYFDAVSNQMGYSPAQPFKTPLKDCLTQSLSRNMQYITVPETCNTDKDCNPTGSDFDAYWCKRTQNAVGRCATKIRIGGSCADNSFGIYPNKACFKQSYCYSTPTCTPVFVSGQQRRVCQCMAKDGTIVNKVDWK